jgi:hypothetical protein
MKKLLLFVLVTNVVLLSSCKKDNLYQSTKEKIKGSWKYEKVTFTGKFSIFSQDVTNEYKDLLLQFDDASFNQININGNNTIQGDWEVDNYYTNNDSYNLMIYGNINDSFNKSNYDYTWENVYVTNKKLTFTESKKEGFYSYKLIKY